MARGVMPVEYWSNAVQIGLVKAQAQGVIAMRLLGAMGVWSVPPSENSRMLTEKLFAFSKGGQDASRAAWAGENADVIASAAVKPIRQKIRANHRRLTKRGIKRK
ncbi:antifreeze protein [Marivita sp.]|uniref:antifreeze protein n=1 Tax=Marivita sp. TaxID=2003365 RepID=UPI0025BF3E07|nr:antifreeze protein [Marivita sp.]